MTCSLGRAEEDRTNTCVFISPRHLESGSYSISLFLFTMISKQRRFLRSIRCCNGTGTNTFEPSHMDPGFLEGNVMNVKSALPLSSLLIKLLLYGLELDVLL